MNQTQPRYHEYLKQIEDLRKKAETARREEIAAAIAEIKQQIKLYGLTADDLGFGERKPRGRPAKAAVEKAGPKKPARKARGASPMKGVKRPIKFRGPEGQPWSGVGKRPLWVTQALAEGRTLAEFEVKN